MNNRKVASEYRMAQWAKILQNRKESGESIRGYCDTRGVSRHRYFYWQRKLRDAAFDHVVSSQANAEQKSMVPVSFAEVQLQPGQIHNSSDNDGQKGKLTAEVLGIRLSADCVYPVDKMAYLLRELVKLC